MSMALERLKWYGRLVRRAARRTAQGYRYRKMSLGNIPILFGNSFPKSGTHLLTQILQAFSKIGPAVDSGLPAVVMYDGQTGEPRSIKTILQELQLFRPGDMGYGHLHAEPELVEILCADSFAPYFILRDPRDVVVSHVYYVTDMEPDHALHPHYTQQLGSFDERLMTSIRGLPEGRFPFDDITGRFQPYLGWLEQPAVLVLRFEDLVDSPQEGLLAILQHACQRGFTLDRPAEQALQTLTMAIDPRRSPTFRSGKTGAWRDHFKPEHIAAFKAIAGELLIDLGYERSHDW
jgi:sulfotransferase 6B1